MSSSTLLDTAMNHSERIIRDAQSGDKAAFNKLVILWCKRIYNFAYKYLNDHDLAAESAQRTFISVYQSLGRLQDLNRFKPWLYKIALNHCRDEERKARSRARLVAASDENHEQIIGNVPDSENSTPDKLCMQNQVSELLLNAMQKLPEEQREVLIMKTYEGLKFREIAEEIGVSENTVKSRLYYGFSNMKKILEKEGVFKESINYGA